MRWTAPASHIRFITWGAEAALAAVHLGDSLLHRVQPLTHVADAFHGGNVAPIHRALAETTQKIGTKAKSHPHVGRR